MREHLRRVESFARLRFVDHLAPARRQMRAWLLDELAAYREAGAFPIPRDSPWDLRPYFIDADGRRSTIAHLMELTGADALVAEIAHTNNNAYVAELVRDPRVAAWADEVGFTIEEAERIEPTLCRVLDCACFPAFVDHVPALAAGRLVRRRSASR